MTNELKIFDYNDKIVRTITANNEPWWVLKDVCVVLGIENHKDVQSRLDKDEVGRFELPHPQNKSKKLAMICISESGLYATIIRSDKLEAKPFRKWVTNEVLPSIRKTGSYSINQSMDILPQSLSDILQAQQQQLSILTQNQQAQTAQLTALTTLITSTLPQPYKPPFTRWMDKTFKQADALSEANNLTRKQMLHQLYNELQDTYDLDLNEHQEEYCYAHGIQNTGMYTLNTIGANSQLKQLFNLVIDTNIEQCCLVSA